MNILANIKQKISNSMLAKGKYTKPKVVIAIIVSILIATALVFSMSTSILDRIPVFAIIICFILLHFIFKVKDIYEFIYKKRYLLAILFMVYVVIMGYSGSSVGTYAEVVQGEYQEKYYTPILGKYRSIRSDEWSVNTPIYTSQAVDEDNRYAYNNDNLRGTQTDMSSIGNAPVLDISLLGKPLNLGYILLGSERGLSFLWYGKLTLLVLISFEFCMLISNKKKLISLLGMFLITFSAATQWWYCTEYFIWGMLVLVLFDKFMLAKNKKNKILCALGIFISGLSYIFIFYPAWQLSFGYIYLAVFIWICIKNRKEYKFSWFDISLVVTVLTLIALIVVRYFIKSSDALSMIMNTDYPGERFELGGGKDAAKVAFSYVYSFLFPYININNPCEYSGMISMFPIPMVVAVIYLIKNIRNKDKHMWEFLIPMLAVSILLGTWTFITTNKLFAKITFLYMVPANRMAVPLGITQILLLIYMMGNIKKEDIIIKNKALAIILTIISSIFIVYMAQKTDIDNAMKGIRLYICGLINLFTIYQIYNIDKEKNRNILIGILIPIAIITGTTVNPIQRGIGALTSKPIAKEVQKIVTEDPENNMWIVDSTNFYIPNYILANGAKVINSTNIYPNFNLYETVLGEKAQNKETKLIYNRYAHLNIEISNENKLELLYQDSIKLYLTTEKLKELGVKYIVSVREGLEKFETPQINYEKMYEGYGMYIYKLKY